MNKELRNLYKQTLRDKWIPLLKTCKKEHNVDYLHGWIMHKCSFCLDSVKNNNEIECEICRINHIICDDCGGNGFYSTIHSIIHENITSCDMEKYLKKMIKLLKIEKLKCIFKRKKRR